MNNDDNDNNNDNNNNNDDNITKGFRKYIFTDVWYYFVLGVHNIEIFIETY